MCAPETEAETEIERERERVVKPGSCDTRPACPWRCYIQLGFNGWINLATDIIKPPTTNDVSVAKFQLDRTEEVSKYMCGRR